MESLCIDIELIQQTKTMGCQFTDVLDKLLADYFSPMEEGCEPTIEAEQQMVKRKLLDENAKNNYYAKNNY